MWIARQKCSWCGTQSKDEYIDGKLVFSSGCSCKKYKRVERKKSRLMNEYRGASGNNIWCISWPNSGRLRWR